jgi:hypothetical protein
VDRAGARATFSQMSEEQRQDNNPQNDEEGEDRAPPNPFDNPFLLPGLLWAFAAWCAYDILTNAKAYQENPEFNQYGLLITGVAALYFTWSAIKEKRAKREKSLD